MTLIDERIAALESNLRHAVTLAGNEPKPMLLSERMAYYHTPGVSIAVINDGEIEWAKGYGVLSVDDAGPITTATLFQAASISKVIAAVGMLKLVDAGKLDLDADVNTYLRRWKVSTDDFTINHPVTLRGILSHTAGLSVHGFEGYEAGVPLPAVTDILDGINGANSAPVRVTCTPGTSYSYSGGGYTILQLLLEDVMGKPFPVILNDLVLTPLGMTNSFFEQPLAPHRHVSAASGHQADGNVLSGQWHVYPELAAAGLWTTPIDLAGFLIAIQQCRLEQPGALLSPKITKQMLTRGIGRHGLGFSVSTSQPGWYGHGGSNVGFRSMMLSLLDSQQGIVVMTNGDHGYDLAREIIRGAAVVYGWPALQPVVRASVDVDTQSYDLLVGAYAVEGAPGFEVIISRRDDRLFAHQPEQFLEPLVLYPVNEREFFILENGMAVRFTEQNDNIQMELETEDAQYTAVKVLS